MYLIVKPPTLMKEKSTQMHKIWIEFLGPRNGLLRKLQIFQHLPKSPIWNKQ